MIIDDIRPNAEWSDIPRQRWANYLVLAAGLRRFGDDTARNRRHRRYYLRQAAYWRTEALGRRS